MIGAGSAAGTHIMTNLLAGGFGGAILPVAARTPAVSGVLAYPDIASLPIAPDLAVVCAEPADIPRTYAALAARGTRAAVVPGWAEGLRALASATGVRSLGPGSFGVAVPSLGLNASRSHLPPRPGRIALVSQSAALCRAVLDWAEPNGVGFSHIVGIGGNDDLGFGVVLDWLSRDPGTGAILLDIRRLKDSRAFLSAMRAAARLRPVVAIRAGGLLMDPSGDADATFVAALRRCGVLCVTTLDDLLAAAETLTRSRPVRGEALAIVTNAIGPARLAADAALRDGLQLAGDNHAFTYAGADDPLKLAAAATRLAAAPEVGGVLIVHAPIGGAPDDAGVQAIAAAAAAMRVPLLVCAMGETTAAPHRRRLAEAGVPVFATPEQSVRGFFHLVQDRRNRAAARELPPSVVLHIAPDRAEVRRLFARARAAGQLTLMQDEATEVLAAYGVPTVPGRAATGVDDAAHAAALLGYPVVLKRHRERHGALVFDLRDIEQVRAAAGLLQRQGEPSFLVQRQVGRARELLVRVGEDPVFGPTIGFGPATAADFTIDLPPLNLPLAHALIARTRIPKLPDQPAANLDAIAGALVRVSQLVVDFPDIAELEINPLFADADGVLAADAWIRLHAAGEAPGRLAIPPYPAELTGSFNVAGETLTIRPIRPEDATAHMEYFNRLPPEDIRFRFFSAVRELSPEQVARFTQVDYEREMAFIAVRETTGETVAVGRLVREGLDDVGEFALSVQPDMKHKGLASHLLERLIDWGRAHGISDIVGQVLADNQPMLAFIRRLGFTLQRMPGQSDVVEAHLRINTDS